MEAILTAEQMRQLAEYIRTHKGDMGYGADVGASEDEATAQEAMSGRLLQGIPNMGSRNDWGSNLGRAGMGVSSALRSYTGGKARREASEGRRKLLGRGTGPEELTNPEWYGE